MFIRFIARLLVICALASQLSGCLWNGAIPLTKGGTPSVDTTVLIYGVRMETTWNAPLVEIELVAYSPEKKSFKGDCLRFDRVTARIPGTPGSTHYFAFEVPAGHYAYSGDRLRGGTQEFYAPAGEVVFVGNFVYTQAKDVELQRDLEAEKPKILAALPDTPRNISLAQSKSIGHARLFFLCNP